jgi:hypothetical protein
MTIQHLDLTGKTIINVNCPRCQEAHEITLDTSLVTESNRFPVKFAYLHGDPSFVLTMFIDRDFQIRGVEISECLEMQREDLAKILDDNRSNTLKELTSDQMLFLIFTNNGMVLRKYSSIQEKITLLWSDFQKMWKMSEKFTTENKSMDEFILKYPDFWIAGLRFDTYELDVVVTLDVDLDRLSTQMMFLVEQFASQI